MSEASNRSVKEVLVEDFNAIVEKAEQFLEPVSGEIETQTRSMRRQVERNLRFAKDRLRDVEYAIADKSRAGARATDRFVHEHPWKTLGAGVTVGVMVGVLVSAMLHRR